MRLYQLKIEIKPYKADEFVDFMRSIFGTIRKEKECIDFSLLQHSERENSYIVVGEWQVHQDMERHFKTNEFEV